MILDAQLLFSDAQPLTATAVSTNIIDLGVQRNIGVGEPMVAIVCADVALAGTTPTLSVSVQFDDTAAFSTPTTVGTSKSYSTLALGGKIVVGIPANSDGEQFVRLNYTLGGTTPTATVTSALQPANFLQNEGYYNDAIKIS